MYTIFLAVLALSVLNAQEPDRAGNQIFRIPAGWSRTESPPSTVLSPDSAPKGRVTLILTGHALAGEFRAAFDQDVRNINGAQRIVTPGQVQSRRTPDGVDLLATTVELQAGNGSRNWRYYLAANPRGRFELMLYLAATPDLFKRYWPDVQQFVAAWNFANLAGQNAPPPGEPEVSAAPAAPAVNSELPAGRLEGVYGGFKYTYGTVLGVVQKQAKNDYFSFFADGTVYWGLPDTGLVGFNMARACQPRPQSCGTYRMSGDQVVILLNRGTYRQAGVRSPGGLNIEGRPYTLQGDPAKSAARALDGIFVRADARPGEDLARKFIRFTRDGHFVDQGLVTTVAGSDISGGNLRFERPGGSGTYRLSQYTLILRYADGYQRGLPIVINPADLDKPVLTQILVNTYTLVLRR